MHDEICWLFNIFVAVRMVMSTLKVLMQLEPLHSVNDTLQEVKNDSVHMKEDADTYGTSDKFDNESSCSSDSDEMTWR